MRETSATLEKKREYRRVRQALYQSKNRDRLNKYCRDRYVAVSSFAEERRESARNYYYRHRQERKEYNRQYRIKNRERFYKKRRERYRMDVLYRLRLLLRTRLWLAIRRGSKAGSAVRDLGCTVEDFVSYISGLFSPGMSWENWGEWHLDHIQPLAAFDLTDRVQFLKACHYTNIQPLWASENCRKKDRAA